MVVQRGDRHSLFPRFGERCRHFVLPHDDLAHRHHVRCRGSRGHEADVARQLETRLEGIGSYAHMQVSAREIDAEVLALGLALSEDVADRGPARILLRAVLPGTLLCRRVTRVATMRSAQGAATDIPKIISRTTALRIDAGTSAHRECRSRVFMARFVAGHRIP